MTTWRSFLSVVLSLSMALPVRAAGPAPAAAGTSSDAGSRSGLEVEDVVPESKRDTFRETREFLIRMGFEDFSAQAQATLDEHPELDERRRAILETNRDRLATLSVSRDLAAYILTRTADRMDDPRVATQLERLTGRLLNFGLRGLPEELPAEVQNIRDAKAREQEADRFLQNYIQDSLNMGIADLRADLLATLYSADEIIRLEAARDADYLREKEALTESVRRFVVAKYAHLEITHIRDFGRALALGLVRTFRQAGRKDREQKLREAVLRHGEILENYISDRYVVVPSVTATGEKAQPTLLELKSGDLLTTYNRAIEDSMAQVKFYPSSTLRSIWQFVTLRLGIQSMREWIPWEQRIDAKSFRGERLTWTETFVAYIMRLPIFRRGYNTVGVVDVKTDPATGLKATWVYANSGNARLGGVKVQDLRNFIVPGMTDRLGHTRLNAKRVAEMNQRIGGVSRVQFGATDASSIASLLSPRDVQGLLKRASQAGWMEKEVAPKAIAMMKNMMVGTEAVGANFGAMADERLFSPGQTVVAAFAAGAGLEIQSEHDVMKLGGSASAGERAAAGRVRTVAPSHWSWDGNLSETQQINFPHLDPRGRVLEFYGSTRPPMESRIYGLVNAGFERFQIQDSTFAYLTQWARSSAEYHNMLSRAVTAEKRSNWRNVHSVSDRLARTPDDGRMSETEMRDFLYDLGFADLAKSVEEAMQRNETYSEATRVQQQRNKLSYGALNAGREIGIYLMSRMQGRLGSEEGRQQVADVVSLLMSQQPQHPMKKMPDEILALPEDQRDSAMDRYMDGLLRKTILEHTKNLVADLIWHLHGDQAVRAARAGTLDPERKKQMEADVHRLEALVATMLERNYMDLQVGQTRFAGRALLALLARQAELRQDETITRNAKQALRRVGLRYENFIGDRWVFSSPDQGGADIEVKVQTLSYVMNRLIDASSALIPWGAQPDPSLRKRAEAAGLIGNPMGALFPNDPVSLAKSGYGWMQKLKDYGSYEWLGDGMSHIGYVVIKESKKSGVKMSWVVDNYPHLLVDTDVELPGNAKHNAGGLRFIGLEQFALTSHHSRYVIADHDPVVFHKMVMEQVAKKGIPKSGADLFPFEMYESKVLPNGKPKVQTDQEAKRVAYRVESSQAALNDLFGEKDPYAFWKKYQGYVEKGFMQDIDRGMIFLWISPAGRYEYGTGFCSSTLPLESIRMTGIDPEFIPGRWIPQMGLLVSAVNYLRKWGFDASKLSPRVDEFMTMAKMQIISPSSLAAQPYVTKYTTVKNVAQSLPSRLNDDWSVVIASNADARAVVDRTLTREEIDQFAKAPADPSEVRALTVLVEHGWEARSGKLGMTFNALAEIQETAKLKGWKPVPATRSEAPTRSQVGDTSPGGAIMCSRIFLATGS